MTNQPRSLAHKLFAPRPVAPSLGRQVGRALGRAVVLSLLLATPVVAVYSLPGTQPFGVGDLHLATPEDGAGAEVVDTPGERILAEHADECWQAGEEPLADLPSAAIVRVTSPGLPGSRGEILWTDDPTLVHLAFDEVLAEIGIEGASKTKHLDPVALCILPVRTVKA